MCLVQCLSDNSLAVVKQIDMSNFSSEERHAALQEARILDVLKHPNITRFKEVYRTKSKKLCIVMEHCDSGSLVDLVMKRRETKELIPED